MANIDHLLDDIRKDKFCKDMRETFCEALIEANAESERVEANVIDLRNETLNIRNEIPNVNANAEIVASRDGELNLETRLNRDMTKGKLINANVEGSYITVKDSVEAPIKNIEILGNTYQDPNNLSHIVSSGVDMGDGTYKMSILSTGKNLFDGVLEPNSISNSSGNNIDYPQHIRSKNYCRVTPNRKLAVSNNLNVQIGIRAYDNKKNFITDLGTDKNIVIPNNCFYIRLVVVSTNLSVKIQLEEGTVATQYEPHKSNKSSILLPVPLEKVGSVADRLYYDEGEKAWCIEKKIKNKKIIGSDLKSSFKGSLPNTRYTDFLIDDLISVLYDDITTNQFVNKRYDPTLDEEYCYTYNLSNANFYINFLLSKYPTKDKLVEHLNNNPLSIKYKTTIPQKIIFPLDQQLILNSHFGTTHLYIESGEAQATIKATVSKSIASSINANTKAINVLGDRVEAIEGLKESQNMIYETDSGSLVCKETKNGLIENISLQGRTLVNLMPSNRTWIINGGGSNASYDARFDSLQLKPNTTYTSILIDASGVIERCKYLNITNKECKLIDYFITNDLSNNTSKLFVYPKTGQLLTNDVLSKVKILLLEGDHTQSPPNYFKDLKSVGEDVDVIEVVSSNEDLRFTYEDGAINVSSGTNAPNVTTYRTSYIKCKQNTNYKLNYNCFVLLYDSSMKFIKSVMGVNPAEANIDFNTELASYIRFYKVKVDFDKVIITNNSYQTNKKPLLYYNEQNELVPVPVLREWDKVENGKYTVGSGQLVLDGSITHVSHIIGSKSTIVIYRDTSFKASDSNNQLHLKCDKLPVLPQVKGNTNTIKEVSTKAIFSRIVGEQGYYVSIPNSELETNTIAGFNKWLQTNPVTVTYQLATPKTYDLAPIELSSYENETLVLCNSGAINPIMEFSITSYINNLVLANRNSISELQDKVFNYVVKQNRLMLKFLYNDYKVGFKVEVANQYNTTDEYDTDLFKLIQDNVGIGKDNYDRLYMEALIDFYFMDFTISFDMYLELLNMIELQYREEIIEDIPYTVVN